MITIKHKNSLEFSVFSFFILFVVLLGSASTARTLAYSSPYGSYGSNSSGIGAGGSSTNTDGGLEDSGYKDSLTKSGSGESTSPNDVTSESSGSSSNSNSTGTTGGKLGGSLDSSIGSDSSVGNTRGGTEGNDTNSKESVIPNNKNNNQYIESSSNTSSSTGQTKATHCDQRGSPSCYSLGFQDGKSNAGTNCPSGHSANYCSGWKVGSEVTGIGTTREIAPGAPTGSHSLEYIQAFNTAAGNPYKIGTKQYQNYQSGLKDAKKAGRDCDKMDTCGGPDLLGNYIKGVLHLSDKQCCGNGFGVYSTKLCEFRAGCIATIMGTLTCPSSELPLPGKVVHTSSGK